MFIVALQKSYSHTTKRFVVNYKIFYSQTTKDFIVTLQKVYSHTTKAFVVNYKNVYSRTTKEL
jgi:hypothetical protein